MVDFMMIPFGKRAYIGDSAFFCILDSVDINAVDKFRGDHTRRIAFLPSFFFLFRDFDFSQAFRLLFFALAVSIAKEIEMFSHDQSVLEQLLHDIDDSISVARGFESASTFCFDESIVVYPVVCIRELGICHGN